MLIFVFQTQHSGLKYILLTTSGVEVKSTVLSVNDIGELSTEEIVDMGMSIARDFTDNIDDVTMSYVDYRDVRIVNSFLVPSSQNTLQEGAELTVVYSRLRSDIFLPAQSVSSYRIDAWMFSIALGLILFCAASVVFTVFRWKAFRARVRRHGPRR